MHRGRTLIRGRARDLQLARPGVLPWGSSNGAHEPISLWMLRQGQHGLVPALAHGAISVAVPGSLIAFFGAQMRALTRELARKDGYTEEHMRRVALRAVQVGKELGLAPDHLRDLAIGGLLHDIGKLSIPDSILKKPAPLTDGERVVVRRHPEWGRRLLDQIGGFESSVRRIVLDHHERLGGDGYPRGLGAGELTVDTRILTVCDVYDALVSRRPYRPPWPHERAISHLHEESGAGFDPRCVAALEHVLERERQPLRAVA